MKQTDDEQFPGNLKEQITTLDEDSTQQWPMKNNHRYKEKEPDTGKESEKEQQTTTDALRESFICDDGTNLLDRTLTDIIEMKEDIDGIYGKGAFKDVAGKKIISLFD